MWTAATLVNLVSVAFTISRTAWLVLAVASVVALVSVPSVQVRRSIATGLVIVVTVLVVVAEVGPSSISSGIPILGTETTQTRASADYRSELLQTALSRHLLKPLGSKTNTLANSVLANYSSVDDEYLNLADQFGYGPGILLALLLPLVLVLSLRRKMPDCLSAMWLAIAAGLLSGVWTVAFITQQQVLIWLVLGVCSGLEASLAKSVLVPSLRTRASRPRLVSAKV
jgi:hypothetical protein